MLVEAAVLGRQHRLDQMVGELVERDRIVVADAAGADLVAVAVEEGDGELGLLQPVVVRGLAEGGDGERQHQDGADGAKRRRLRGEFVEHAPPAGDVEAVHEAGEALVGVAQPGVGAEQAGIDAGVGAEEEVLDFRLPIGRKQVAQGARSLSGCRGRLNLADRRAGGQGRGGDPLRRMGANCGEKGPLFLSLPLAGRVGEGGIEGVRQNRWTPTRTAARSDLPHKGGGEARSDS